MPKTFKRGEKVKWDTSQGETSGKVLKRLTAKTKIKGHTARASKDDPQYLVQSDKPGAQAAHRPTELKKT
jgi:hypothetical protein